MRLAARWLPLVGFALLAGAFAILNREETVSLRLGIVTLHQMPLTLTVFGSFVLGMVAMLVAGLRHDLQLRRELQARGLLDAPADRAPAPDPRPDPAPAAYDGATES